MAVKKLSELTVAELKHELKKRKLEVVGDKATLLARLKKSLVEDGGKSKAAAAQNKSEDQTKKTPIITESTSQEPKDVLKPQTEDLNTSEQLVTSSSEMAANISSLNTSVPANIDSSKENNKLSSVGTELNDKKQDQVKNPVVQTTASESTKDFDNKSGSSNLLGSIPKNSGKQNNNAGPSPSVKETDAESKSGKSEVKLDVIKPKETPKPIEEKKIVAVPKQDAIKSTPIPFLNDSPATESTNNLVSDNHVNEKNKTIDTATPLKTTPVISTSGAINSQQTDGSSVKTESAKKDEDGKNKLDEPTTLWITGLVGVVKASDLKLAFGKFGKVSSAKIVTSAKNPGSKCFGLITMQTHADANACIENFHNKVLLGSTITVEFDAKRRIAKPIQQLKGDDSVDDGQKDEKKENLAVNLEKKTPEKPKENDKTQPPPPKVSKTEILKTSTPVAGSKPVSITTVTPIAKQPPTTKPVTTTTSSSSSATVTEAPAAGANLKQPAATNKPIAAKPESVSTSVWLSGLPSKVKAADLKTLCLVAGKVLAAKVVASLKSTTYFGLVTMANKEEAEACVKKLNKYSYEGKTIFCELAPYNNVTPELLKHFSKGKDQSQPSNDKIGDTNTKNDESNKKAVDEQSTTKDDKDSGNKDKVNESTGSKDAGATGKSSQNQSNVNRNNKSNITPRNNNNRNNSNRNNSGFSNFRRGGYNNNNRFNNRSIPSLLESNPFEVGRMNQLGSPPGLFGDPMRNYGGRNRLEQERIGAERAKLLLFQEQQRQQQMSFRGDGWSQPPSRMKRSFDDVDDSYWGTPSHQPGPKRFSTQPLVPSSYSDNRMGPGPQNYW